MKIPLLNMIWRRKLLPIIALLLLCNTSIVAQYSLYKPERYVVGENDIYRAKIRLLDDTVNKVEGALFHVTDSSIFLSNSFDDMDYRLRKYAFTEYAVADLKRISVAKDNRLKRSTLRGGLIGGLAFGGLTFMAFASAPPETSSGMLPATLLTGAAGFIGGAIIGVGIGAIHLSIPINGNQDKFLSRRKKLNKRAINKH